jgi:glycosyl transferase family 87
VSASRTSAGADRRRRTTLIVTFLLILIAVIPAIGAARTYLTDFSRPGDAVDPFTDALTYLAAGERLNSGHHLYSMGPGDRQIYLYPPGLTVPLLSPPPIAAIWRPLAALPFGFSLWVLACWIALLGTIAYLVIRVGWPVVVLCLLLAPQIGEQLAVANMTAMFPAAFVLAWRWRQRPATGVMVGVLAVLKIIPGTLLGWYLGHRPRAFVWAVVAGAGLSLASLVLVGPSEFFDYVRVLGVGGASPSSIGSSFAMPWLNMAILVVGAIAAALIRNEAFAFTVAVTAAVAGNPALYGASLVPLLALFAPLIPEPEVETAPAAKAGAGSAGTREGLPTGTIAGDDGRALARP